MDLSTATPVEIDTIIADLERQAWEQAGRIASALRSLHYAVGDQMFSRTSWNMTDDEVVRRAQNLLDHDERPDFIKFRGSTAESVTKSLKTIAEAQAEQIRLNGEIEIYESEFKRRPWSRFFMLQGTANAHIHSHSGCQGLHRSDPSNLGWHPNLSGQSEKEAVDNLGPVMCSKCFRSAPVEWRRDPKDLVDNPNICPGALKPPVEGTLDYRATYGGGYYEGRCTGCGEVRRARNDRTMGKHDKPKVQVNEIMAPDGSPLKVGGDIFKTVRTAEISYVDDAAYLIACQKGYRGTGRIAEAVVHSELVLRALAAKYGTSTEEQAERLAKRVEKKVKDYRL